MWVQGSRQSRQREQPEVGLSYSNKCGEDNISEEGRGGITLVGDMVRTPQVQTV